MDSKRSIELERNNTARPERAQKVYMALEKLLARLSREFTGTAAIEMDVKQGGVTLIRLQTRELV